MDSEQNTTPREDLDTLMDQMRGYPPSRVAAAVWDWMAAQGFRNTRPARGGDEKLIEATGRLEQCLANREAGIGAWSMVRPEDVRTMLDALAVFEKAHTPTDDEREAPQPELCDRCGWAVSAHARSMYGLDCPMSSRPGFRRSEVPEPSLCTSAYCIPRDDHHVSSCPNRPKPQGEPSDLSDDEEARADAFDEHMASNAQMIRDLAQGEPSELCAQSEPPSSENAYTGIPLSEVLRSESQGKPSDADVLEGFLGKLAGDGAYTLDFSSAVALHGHIVRLLKRDIAALRASRENEIRCDYCGSALPGVKDLAHVPTTPDMQRMGFDVAKVVCPECVGRARAAVGVR